MIADLQIIALGHELIHAWADDKGYKPAVVKNHGRSTKLTRLRNFFCGNGLLPFFIPLLFLSFGTVAKADSKLDLGPGYLKTQTGVIFSAAASEKSGACAVNKCWTPSVDDISRLEDDLPEFFGSSTAYGSAEIHKNIAQYKRKYFGFIQKGKKFILVSGLCDIYWRPGSKKFLSPQRPMTDMGSCFFLLDYDVKARRFSDLYIDGEA